MNDLSPSSTPARGDDQRPLKIVLGVALGCVMLCGLVGSCVLVLTLLIPFLTGAGF